MTFLSSLADDITPLVVDTSVVINLYACGYGHLILDALPNDILVPELVAAEFGDEARATNAEHHFLKDLIITDTVRLAALAQHETELFGHFVSERPSLGDGEAATIAIGICRQHLPVIDERRGRLRAKAYLNGKRPGWSIDILYHPHVVTALGSSRAVDALYHALRDGRMRIHEDHCEQVVSLLGAQRALDCNSLPGYKHRQHQWRVSLDTEVTSRSLE